MNVWLHRLQNSASRLESSVNNHASEVFLSHNSKDKPFVEEVVRGLEQAGIGVWLDKTHLEPGGDWVRDISEAIRSTRICLVFAGSHGMGPVQNAEVSAVLVQRMTAGVEQYLVIPVLLPNTTRGDLAKLLVRLLMAELIIQNHAA